MIKTRANNVTFLFMCWHYYTKFVSAITLPSFIVVRIYFGRKQSEAVNVL